ncbi:undecaprenyl diphosphate synthase family protein, partial [Staphylococcus aureus]|uniref:undecaprenyl diphosphate synthase family protein n=1 Tax=Staphylococcus aureus TaxID=1280 RepID=UPI0010DF02E9
KSTIEAINNAKEKTANNTGLKLIFAIYINNHLMTKDYPDPELLIRTSGEQRISNFLIWQVSYSEFIFNQKLWPDFDEDELIKCIKIYQSRQRRFGGLSEE